jgi:hypothetical protein
LVTDDRHLINVGLEAGTIVALYHGPRRGMAALERMLKLSGGELTLNAVQRFDAQQGLAPTRELLRILEQRSLNPPPQPGALSAAAEPPTPRLTSGAMGLPPAAAGAGAVDLAPDLIRVEEALLQQVGPIAKLVFNQALTDTGGVHTREELMRLVQVLSAEIEDPVQARHFLDQALGRKPR